MKLTRVLVAALAVAALAGAAARGGVKTGMPDQAAAPAVGTKERPVREITLPSGEIFYLRLPRFLKNPEVR